MPTSSTAATRPVLRLLSTLSTTAASSRAAKASPVRLSSQNTHHPRCVSAAWLQTRKKQHSGPLSTTDAAYPSRHMALDDRCAWEVRFSPKALTRERISTMPCRDALHILYRSTNTGRPRTNPAGRRALSAYPMMVMTFMCKAAP